MKQRTRSGAKKRFKITGTGKIMHRRAGKVHLNLTKSSSRLRRLRGEAPMASGDASRARKMLGR